MLAAGARARAVLCGTRPRLARDPAAFASGRRADGLRKGALARLPRSTSIDMRRSPTGPVGCPLGARGDGGRERRGSCGSGAPPPEQGRRRLTPTTAASMAGVGGVGVAGLEWPHAPGPYSGSQWAADRPAEMQAALWVAEGGRGGGPPRHGLRARARSSGCACRSSGRRHGHGALGRGQCCGRSTPSAVALQWHACVFAGRWPIGAASAFRVQSGVGDGA